MPRVCAKSDGWRDVTVYYGIIRSNVGLGSGHWPRGPRATPHRDEDLLRLRDDVRCPAELACLPGLPRLSGRAAGAEPPRRRARGARGLGDGVRRTRAVDLRAQELLLPR